MKVNVPKQGDMKRYKHDLLHDVSTTSDVGFLQPFMVREFPGDSHAKITCGQIVRFANMVKPTFGSISLNTYNVFVPIESVYHPYGSLRTQQTYMGANATYIPQSVIKVSPFILNVFCRMLSHVEVWTANAGTLTEFNNDINFAAGAFTNVTDATQGATYIGQFISDLNGMAQDFGYQSNPASRIAEEISTKVGTVNPGPSFVVSTSTELGLAQGYDWIYCIKGSGSTPDKVYGGRYTRACRNIRKVLYGCGFKLIDDNEPLSFLPVMAYYKAWFDLFAPQRNTTWKDEAFAGFQEYCEQYGMFIIDDFLDVSTLGQPGELFVQMMLDLAKCYITSNPDFVSAHITGQRIGTTPNISLKYEPAARSLTDGYVSNVNSQVPTFARDASGSAPSNSLQNILTPMGLELLMKVQKRTNVHTALGGRVRELLKSITGDDYLEEDASYWIGAQKVDILINPVFNTAESSEAALGQFAGAAFGSSQQSQKELSYDCKELGFWVCFGTIVPDARFCQGMDMMLKHVGQFDFYDPMVDSSTMVPTARKYIFAEKQICMRSDKGFSDSFGNVPAQIEYCIAQNIQNGDMSLMSTRASYLPWTLDKLLPYDHIRKNSNNTYSYVRLDPDLLVNGTIWRYLGLSRWIGQFDRIWEQDNAVSSVLDEIYENWMEDLYFYYGAPINDNVSIQCTIFGSYWHSKLPVRDSYHTGAIDDGMTVEIA